MKLSNLSPKKGSVKSSKRVARGQGSGKGGTATRGHKGAKSRSGYSSKRHFEGGQMPLQGRLPKRGFKNTHARYQSNRPNAFVPFNLDLIAKIAEKHNLTEVSFDSLREINILAKTDLFKVLGGGELTASLSVMAHRFSKSAKEAITKAGGQHYLILSMDQVQAVAHGTGAQKIDKAALAASFDYIAEDDKIYVTKGGAVNLSFELVVDKIADDAKAALEGQGGSVTIL